MRVWLKFLKNKYFTFGSFNNFAKINSDVVSVWSNILKKINNSKLILEYVPNVELDQKLNTFLKELDYKPNRIAYRQKIANDLYKNKKYYLD